MGFWTWLGNNPTVITSVLDATIGKKANRRLEAVFDRLRAMGIELDAFATAREKLDELAEGAEELPPLEVITVELTAAEVEALDEVLDLVAVPTRKIRKLTRRLERLDPTP